MVIRAVRALQAREALHGQVGRERSGGPLEGWRWVFKVLRLVERATSLSD